MSLDDWRCVLQSVPSRMTCMLTAPTLTWLISGGNSVTEVLQSISQVHHHTKSLCVRIP